MVLGLIFQKKKKKKKKGGTGNEISEKKVKR